MLIPGGQWSFLELTGGQFAASLPPSSRLRKSIQTKMVAVDQSIPSRQSHGKIGETVYSLAGTLNVEKLKKFMGLCHKMSRISASATDFEFYC